MGKQLQQGLTYDQAAQKLGKSKRYIQKLVQEGRLTTEEAPSGISIKRGEPRVFVTRESIEAYRNGAALERVKPPEVPRLLPGIYQQPEVFAPMEPPEWRWLRPKEAATLLGLTPGPIYRLIQNGLLLSLSGRVQWGATKRAIGEEVAAYPSRFKDLMDAPVRKP